MQSIRTQNHRFYYSFYANSTKNQTPLNTNFTHPNPNFKTITFKPFITQKSELSFIKQLNKKDDKSNLLGRLVRTKSTNVLAKWVLCMGAMSLFMLPVKGFLTPSVPQEVNSLDKLIKKGEMTIATTKDDSTVFQHGDILHGFGHDVVARYADELGVSLNLEIYDSQQEAIDALNTGMVDGLLSAEQVQVGTPTKLACDDKMAKKVDEYGLNGKTSLVFNAKDDSLINHAQAFLCNPEELAVTGASARFYDQTLLDNEYSDKHFKRAIAQKLPLYENAFKRGAKAHNHDWQVLAVISYQESHLDPSAVSRTGVEGLMMLTQDTAKEMGIQNRADAVQSIQGGAKYLEILEKLYADVPEAERLWFVLASYNMGPNAVKRIQSELNAKGRDGNSWAEVYGYLSQNAKKNSRYVQCMHYVSNIRTYLETIKTMEV